MPSQFRGLCLQWPEERQSALSTPRGLFLPTSYFCSWSSAIAATSMVAVCSSGPAVATVGTVTIVLPAGDAWATFCRVGPRLGRVRSCSGLTTFSTVLPSCMAAVLRTVRLDASGWISTVLGKAEPEEARTV